MERRKTKNMDTVKPISAALLIFISGSALANNGCPTIGIAERTPGMSGYQYATSGKHSLDKDGIVLFDYGSNYNNLGKWKNPYFNSNYANALYRDWLDTECSNDTIKSQFLRVADWYIETAVHKSGMALWTHPFYTPYFDLQPGWISGIGQARIAGVLYRANAITGDKKYLSIANEAMVPYTKNITDGGVVTFDNDATWIEEAPDPKGRSYKILNGHITALSGIADIYQITNDHQWKDLLVKGERAVSRDLHKFDGGFSSYYSLDWPVPARRTAERGGYNSLHVSQLIWMYDHFNNPEYLKWASHFQSYDDNRDKYEASYSVNAKTNGPEKAKALLFGSSWTTNEFPTTFTITPENPARFKGIAIDALDISRRPIDFNVKAYKNGRIVAHKDVNANESLWRDVLFKWPVVADKLEVTFTKGDRITALTSLMAIRNDIELAPITNQCNRARKPDTTEIAYTFQYALDGSPSTKMSVRCDGWFFIPMKKGEPYLRVSGDGIDGATFRIKNSWNMKTWGPEKSVSVNSGERIRINGKYAMISFSKDVKAITDISTAAK